MVATPSFSLADFTAAALRRLGIASVLSIFLIRCSQPPSPALSRFGVATVDPAASGG